MVAIILLSAFAHVTAISHRGAQKHGFANSPVSINSAVAVVTMADEHYASCASRLVASVREHGRFDGDIWLLLPSEADRSRVQFEVEPYHVRIFRTLEESDGGVNIHGKGPSLQYEKLQLFTAPVFRKYERLIFLDADGIVQQPLAPLLKVSLPHGQPVALATWWGQSLFSTELNFWRVPSKKVDSIHKDHPDRDLVGSTAWMIIDTAHLPSEKELGDGIRRLLLELRAQFTHNDQGLVNLLFQHPAFFPVCAGPDRLAFANVNATLGAAVKDCCTPKSDAQLAFYTHWKKDCVARPQKIQHPVESRDAPIPDIY
eukprot:gnl/MRDRNA2_/MRDRNA2_147382_c0_seq1.p1 gnl/MRDRNA2_/MRDRNA2_147382_c0~~gnl/MRDRNA2_/MRDRNA2_147382_c0_seq1.p1  ORF type:complete len:315 (+),score=37.56 gnl/MRDRNA2_/MRDRNA2_147382_c0_seq1:115-1059(+)